MKKQLLFFIFFLGNLLAHGQSEYGILIKTTLNPRIGGYSTRYTIEGRKDNLIRFTTGNIQPTNQTLVQYNFYYITDINQFYYLALQMDSSNNVRCVEEYTVPNTTTITSDQYFSSCFGYSNVYGIHLTQPDDNSICANENINLNEGWNYQYRYDAEAWKPLPSQFQDKRSIGIKLKDLGGYDGKTQVFFMAGYQNQFTNIVTYNIIGCSPELDGPLVTEKTKCKFESSGSVILKFKTELKDSEKFLFNLFKNGVFDKSIFVTKDQIINNTYTWTGLAEESYYIKYQSQAIGDGTTLITGNTAIVTDSFLIESPDPLTFTLTELQPNCHDEQGAIQINASGGTPPYYYMIDNETLEQKHPLTASAIQLSEGDHKVIVVDSNFCIEK